MELLTLTNWDARYGDSLKYGDTFRLGFSYLTFIECDKAYDSSFLSKFLRVLWDQHPFAEFFLGLP